MKKSYILGGMVIIIVILLIAFFRSPEENNYSNNSEEEQVVDLYNIEDYGNIVSDARDFAIKINEDQLPAEVNMDDIKIEAINMPIEGTDASSVVAYNLMPDGLSFNSPIEVTFKVLADSQDFSPPLLVHYSGENENEVAQLVNDVLSTYDSETNSYIVSGQIDHFSEIALWQVPNLFVMSSKNTDTRHLIDETITAKFEVRPTQQVIKIGGKYGTSYGYDEFSFQLGKLWAIDGKLTGDYSSVMTPEEVDILDRRGLTIAQTYEVKGDFTCKKAGTEGIGGGHNVDKAITISYPIHHRKLWKWSTEDESKLRVSVDETVDRREYLHFSERHICLSTNPQINEANYVSLLNPDPNSLNCKSIELLSPDLGGKERKVHKLKDGSCYEQEQFGPGTPPDECKELHYHYQLTSLEGNIRNDSHPCGAAVKSDIVASGSVWTK